MIDTNLITATDREWVSFPTMLSENIDMCPMAVTDS